MLRSCVPRAWNAVHFLLALGPGCHCCSLLSAGNFGLGHSSCRCCARWGVGLFTTDSVSPCWVLASILDTAS